MADDNGGGFLDDLPDLDLPDPPRRQVQQPELDPVQKLMAQIPYRSRTQWEAVHERFRVTNEQVRDYLRGHRIKKCWMTQLKKAADSAKPTLVFERALEWPRDRAQFYAVMAICAQSDLKGIVLIPAPLRAMEWYKSHESWVPGYVFGMDMAPQLLAYIEQDLGKLGLLDGKQPKEIPEERVRASANTGTPQGEPTPDAGQGPADNVSDNTPADPHQWCLISLSKKDIGLALGLADDKKIAQTLNALCRDRGIVLKPKDPHEKHPKAWFVAIDTLKEPLLGRFDTYVRNFFGLKTTH